ncbi:MAG TPA: hypothetical protein VG452_06220 [Egibacteraceae bacterium]|nr:hypothetical protein [Egibacteraceae bacterium]
MAIESPCLVELATASAVRLHNVELRTAILNIDDRAADAGGNRIHLQRVNFVGGADAGLLISLNDPADTFRSEASSFHYPQGIALEVGGTRQDLNEGGTITLVASELLAEDAGGVGIWLAASEHDGSFEAVETVAESPAGVTVVAGSCRIQRHGQPIDCSTATVADDLARQAQEADDEN